MFKLEFSTDNAAFNEGGENGRFYEVADILLRVAQCVQAGALGGAVQDSNGNTIGRWSLSEDEL